MSKIKIIANVKDGDYQTAVSSVPTFVYIGDEKLEQVVGLKLEPRVGGLWELTLTLNVNPVDLIVPTTEWMNDE